MRYSLSCPQENASVAKLVDATDSKSVDSNIMLVQVRPEVPNLTTVPIGTVVLLFCKGLCGFDNGSFY